METQAILVLVFRMSDSLLSPITYMSVWCQPSHLSNRERDSLAATEHRNVLSRYRKTLPCTYPVKAPFLSVVAPSQNPIGLDHVCLAQRAPNDFTLLA